MAHQRWLPLALVCSLATGCASSGSPAGSSGSDPAVVVMISVDQLRADLVTRYAPFYTDGMKRLIEQGAHFDGVHDHGWSETAPGHATLSTGVVPARSGIVANDFMIRRGDQWVDVYNVGDDESPIIGFPDMQGMSPKNLLRSGLAEWVSAADPAAKVVSIAGKDRSAVLMGAHVRGTVYWYDTGRQRFVTSAYYGQDDPDWVNRFNAQLLPTLLDSAWVAQAPAGAQALARPDAAPYEGSNHLFPHRFAQENDGDDSFADWVSRTPYPDRAVLELAKVAVRENGLGDDGVTDFLALGFSQADRIGHRYGPLSREQLENLMHLDRVLGDLFRFLDEEIGEGKWVAGLSADHGARTMPEWEAEHGIPQARRLTGADRRQMTEVANAARAAAPAGQEAQAAARALGALPFLAGVYTREEIAASGSPGDSVLRLLRNSYHPERTKSEIVRSGTFTVGEPYMYMSTSTTGSGHGTVWYYDRSVPLIFLGAGVNPGRRSEMVRTVDLAPTLAALAGVEAPGDLDGRVLEVR